jgi:hypothetical protein
MTHRIVFLLLIAVSAAAGPALLRAQGIDPAERSAPGIDRSELEGAQEPVDFINYTGAHATVDSRAAIVAIGRALASPTADQSVYSGGRYGVTRVRDAAAGALLDADILTIGANATVDHIRNLRLIISSYISAQYGYTPSDAATLAVFVTVYNAVYRSRLDVFAQKYSPLVVGRLTAEQVGLSTLYRDWPGKSQVVIPLANRRGAGLTIIDTTTISEPEVIDSLRTEEDRGLSDREQMAALKDREAEERQALADQAAAEAAEAERQAQAEKDRLLAEQQKLAEVQKEAAAAANNGSPNAAARANAAQAQAQATQAQGEKAEEAAEAAVEARAEAEALQQEAAEKREEASQDRAEIALDREALEAPPPMPPSALMPGIQVLVQKVQVNPDTLALAGTPSPATAALLLQDGEGYYGLGEVGGAWVVSRYSGTLQLQSSSAVALARESSLVITEAGLLVTGADGLPQLLDKENLALVIKK